MTEKIKPVYDPQWHDNLSARYQVRALSELMPGKLFATEAYDLKNKEYSIGFSYYNPEHYSPTYLRVGILPWESLGIIYPDNSDRLYSLYHSLFAAELYRNFSVYSSFKILFCGLNTGALQNYTIFNFKKAAVYTVEPDSQMVQLYSQLIKNPIGQIANISVEEYVQSCNENFDLIIIDVRSPERIWDLSSNADLVALCRKKAPAVVAHLYASETICQQATKLINVKSSNPIYTENRVIAVYED